MVLSSVRTAEDRLFESMNTGVDWTSQIDRLSVVVLDARRAVLPRIRSGILLVHPLDAPAVLRDGDRRTMELRSGELLIVGAERPHELRSQGRVLIVGIPDEAAGPASTRLAKADGSIIRTDTGTAGLLRHLLGGVVAQVQDEGLRRSGRVAQHIVGMLALAVVDPGRRSHRPQQADLRDAAMDYIEAHLPEWDLAPDRIAAEVNVSTRTLHRLFEAEGTTIRSWIRSRRVEHCRIELADDEFDALSVSEIGARWGLWDAAHLSRVFKAAFDVSPRAYRASVRHAHNERVPA